MEALTSFIVLLIISVVVSAVLHYGLKYYVNPGHWSFASKIVVGYLGALWGDDIFGRWIEPVRIEDVYVIPAVVGSIALLILAVDVGKMVTRK
ncbi:MAG: hypothetical protein O7A69_04175 [SAR324 cluster bacterium]|nr:hypothetical protein [SAR324 cluster bacterium]